MTADGNLAQRAPRSDTDRRGPHPHHVSYTYNDHGELATVTQPDGATSGGTAQPRARRARTRRGDHQLHLRRCRSRRHVINADGNSYDYTYNEYSKVTQVTLTSNSTSQASPAGQAGVQAAGGGCDLVLDSYAYDPAGLLAAATDAMGRTTNYIYNGDQQLIDHPEPTPPRGPAGQSRLHLRRGREPDQ